MFQKVNFKFFFAAAALSTGLVTANQIQASVVQCGTPVCAVNFQVGYGGQSGGGQMMYDADTGNIWLNLNEASLNGLGKAVENIPGGTPGAQRVIWRSGGSEIWIDSLGGNADPIINFGLGASTTGGSGASFSFIFDLPIALEGPINASSSVSYSLTSGTPGGAQVAPLGSNNTIVSAFEVDTSVDGLGSFNKGVDVGDLFSFTGGPQTQDSEVFTAFNSFAGNLAYDLMTVKVDFVLSANSSVGISGFVEQVVIPVPAAVWLFGSGLIGLVGVARRRK